MSLAKVGEIIYMHFTVFDTDGITPLTGQAGGCTSSLRKNSADTGETVTIAEIGATGRYYATFTPISIASYDLEVTCPDDRVMGDAWETEINDLDDIASKVDDVDVKIDTIPSNVWRQSASEQIVAGTLGEYLNRIFDIEHGRWLIDEVRNQQLFYDDDDSNLLVAVFNLYDLNGNPASTNVYERRPVDFEGTEELACGFTVLQSSAELPAGFDVA